MPAWIYLALLAALLVTALLLRSLAARDRRGRAAFGAALRELVAVDTTEDPGRWTLDRGEQRATITVSGIVPAPTLRWEPREGEPARTHDWLAELAGDEDPAWQALPTAWITAEAGTGALVVEEAAATPQAFVGAMRTAAAALDWSRVSGVQLDPPTSVVHVQAASFEEAAANVAALLEPTHALHLQAQRAYADWQAETTARLAPR